MSKAVQELRNALEFHFEKTSPVLANMEAVFDELKEAQRQLAAVTAKCAEMRQHIEKWTSEYNTIAGIERDKSRRIALSDDCGKGYVPVAELEKWHVDNCPYAKRLADEQALKGGQHGV